MKKAEFDSLKVTFDCKKDPLTKKPINFKFKTEDFTKVEHPQEVEGMFKMAAYLGQEEISAKDSVKYQVLCDKTAMIGVIKQKSKASGEMEEITIKVGQEEK